MTPVTLQRLESGALALLTLVAVLVVYPGFIWMPFALFLVFDLSAIGYAFSTRIGARVYNLGHSHLAPAALAMIAIIVPVEARGPWTWWCGMIALSWGFHIAVDRMLGYGLKLSDAFTHTHLGWIGRDRERRPADDSA